MRIPNPYESIDYRLLMVVPVILVAFSLIFLAPHLEKGIDLKGGLLVTLQTDKPIDTDGLKAALGRYGNVEVRQYQSPAGNGVEVELENDAGIEAAGDSVGKLATLQRDLEAARIEFDSAKQSGQPTIDLQAKVTRISSQMVSEANTALKAIGSTKTVTEADGASDVVELEFANKKAELRDAVMRDIRKAATFDSYSFREVGSSLSRFFVSKTQEIILYSFILTAIVVLVVFRSLAPSIAVIFGAVADVSLTVGAMSIFHIPLTLAAIATLLMLIGFSLDTDVMLTMRVFKRREGHPRERAFDAMKTGFLMNLTTLGAFGVLFLLGSWLQLDTYRTIGAIAVIGGVVDFIATWCFNAGLILWFVERQEGQKKLVA